jgi:hypothetical protein
MNWITLGFSFIVGIVLATKGITMKDWQFYVVAGIVALQPVLLGVSK